MCDIFYSGAPIHKDTARRVGYARIRRRNRLIKMILPQKFVTFQICEILYDILRHTTRIPAGA